MVGLGMLLVVVGLILWLTVLPALGWTLMAIGAVVALVGLFLGAVWTFSAASRRRTYV